MAAASRRYSSAFLWIVLMVFGLKEACSQPLRSVHIRSVSENHELMQDDGKSLLLQSLELPTRESCRLHEELCPLVDQLEQYFRNSLVGRSLVIRKVDAYARNRYGLPLLQLEELDGRWVQQHLLEQGLARLRGGEQMTADETVMLRKAEKSARQAGRGIWGTEFGAVKSADDPGKLWPFLNSFQLVEGTLQKAAYRGDWLYLNFGSDWREDFTVAIHHNDLSAQDWSQLIDDLWRRRKLSVEGRYTVRVRGVLSLWNGPVIVVAHPKEIELSDVP
ncbi:thermonuclease family protein [Kiloniella sp. b19]|uniref:thermonuclease family protein n=1 Tax=Kiloniella sp. GXU_MW_B19 TaxID=3141326 RepID=UPI0031E37573